MITEPETLIGAVGVLNSRKARTLISPSIRSALIADVNRLHGVSSDEEYQALLGSDLVQNYIARLDQFSDANIAPLLAKPEAPPALDIVLDYEATLSLYTPFWEPKQRTSHTRSVLLCKKTPTLPLGRDNLVVVDGITFSLVVSFDPRKLTQNQLIRYILRRHGDFGYGRGQSSDSTVHARLRETDKDNTLIDNKTKLKLTDIDNQNSEEYSYCKRAHLFDDDEKNDIPWRWMVSGNNEITDARYRWMQNVNIIRGVYDIDIRNKHSQFANEKQLRLVFDSHRILYSLLGALKNRIDLNDGGLTHEIKVLDLADKTSGRYDRYDLSVMGAAQRYIERQVRVIVSAGGTLNFPHVEQMRGGLLQPSSCKYNDAVYGSVPNTLESMMANRLPDEQSRKKDAPESIGYNRFYIDLESVEALPHVWYTQKKTTFGKVTIPAKKAKAKATGSGRNQTTKKAQKGSLNSFLVLPSVNAPPMVTTEMDEKTPSEKRCLDEDEKASDDEPTAKKSKLA